MYEVILLALLFHSRYNQMSLQAILAKLELKYL